jgi:hypothetical protein
MLLGSPGGRLVSNEDLKLPQSRKNCKWSPKIKSILYAGKYLQEGNKVILEEVFPEIRKIILDMIEKFEG